MRKFAIFALLLIPFFTANAQIVSFNSTEINELRKALKTDTAIARGFREFENETKTFLQEKPNPVDTIRSEGLLKGNPIKTRTWKALQDMNKMYNLALLFRLTGNKQYLNHSITFLSTWATINHPEGNPVNDTNLDYAIEAYDLIKEKLSATQKALISKWLKQTADAEINSKKMTPGRTTAINNWNAHRLKIVGKIGYTLNDTEIIKWTLERLKKHVDTNLNADGTSWDFRERDAMHYHIYDLEPLLQLAICIDRANGPNFYTYQSPRGASIQKSVDWLIPYVNEEKQHEEYVHTKVQFDRDRAKNGEAGYGPGTFFKPELALPVFRLATYFDPSLFTILQMINKSETPWQKLIQQVKRKAK